MPSAPSSFRFKIHSGRAAGFDSCEKVRSVANTQYYEGEIVKVIAGRAEKVAAGDKGTHYVETMLTPDNKLEQAIYMKSTADCEWLLVKAIGGGLAHLRSKIVPLLTSQAVTANTNDLATEVNFTNAGLADGALAGGTVYCPEVDQQRNIVTDVKTSNDHLLTVSPGFGTAENPIKLGVGHTIRAVPFSKGKTAVKFDATYLGRGIGTAVADATGGHNKIEDVNLSDYPAGYPEVISSIPDLE